MKKRIGFIMDGTKKKTGAAILGVVLAATMCSGMVFAASTEKIPWSTFAVSSNSVGTAQEEAEAEGMDPEKLLGKNYEDMTLAEYEKAMAKSAQGITLKAGTAQEETTVSKTDEQETVSSEVIQELLKAVKESVEEASEDTAAASDTAAAASGTTAQETKEETITAAASGTSTLQKTKEETAAAAASDTAALQESEEGLDTGKAESGIKLEMSDLPSSATSGFISTGGEGGYTTYRNLPFTLKDAEGKSHSIFAGIWYEYSVKDKTAITVKEYNQALENMEKELVNIVKSRSYEELKKEKSYDKISEEMNAYIKKNPGTKVVFKKGKLDVLSEHTQYGSEAFYENMDQEAVKGDLKSEAKRLGYQYLECDFKENEATDEKMGEQFQKNGLTAEDQVLVVFKDSYVVYNPYEDISLTGYCSNGTYGVKVTLTSGAVEEFEGKDLEKAAADAEEVVFQILRQEQDNGDKADLQKKISAAVGKKTGISEKYLQVVVDDMK